MGRRRRKAIRIPRKRLPKVFLCPRCGKEAVRVEFAKDEGNAIVRCGSCGFSEKFPAKPSYKDIDIYCKFTDKYYGERKVSNTATL
ncbi:MAG: hypothetical protein JSV51_04475 [Candidatus Bathyarchaeota archaeon]|nr:MAG: hypothetical protein JSV51_04475 [Candidatus Bathyarchaeota archaeon]